MVESNDVVRGMWVVALQDASRFDVELLGSENQLVCRLHGGLDLPLLFFIFSCDVDKMRFLIVKEAGQRHTPFEFARPRPTRTDESAINYEKQFNEKK